MQADQLIGAIWARCDSVRSVYNACSPDVRLSSWALVTLPHGPDVTLRLECDWPQVHVSLNIPLMLQFWAEHADVW